ncbi:MAG: ADP-ribosylglycohydrolase family protein [Actinomycetota bacterium]|nr:ADP-ribosylglycohydrolase family protein [Actinomycetota bacterium]
MIGAIAGDIIGSVYEWDNVKTTEFPLLSDNIFFTDDTVLTIATADCLLNKKDFAHTYRQYFMRYPGKGYGGSFTKWAESGSGLPYNSWGNGSAMRVSPIGFAFDDIELVLETAEKSAIVTHSHPEGIKGAKSVAAAVFLARQGKDKDEIKDYIENEFEYDLEESIESIKKWYSFDVSCQGSVPQAIRAFYESEDFEDAIRKAISIGGDSDTIACITGGIAEAFYKVIPENIKIAVFNTLDEDMKKMTFKFYQHFIRDIKI